MLAYCKRNVLENNYTADKSYLLKWSKGSFYNYRLSNEIENIVGKFYYIESEIEFTIFPLNEKEFNRYFTRIEDLRDIRISTILDNSI